MPKIPKGVAGAKLNCRKKSGWVRKPKPQREWVGVKTQELAGAKPHTLNGVGGAAAPNPKKSSMFCENPKPSLLKQVPGAKTSNP